MPLQQQQQQPASEVVVAVEPSNNNNLERPHHGYHGQGTNEDPFIVEFGKDDPINPMNWFSVRKWFITAVVTLSVFAVTFTSSAYSESSREIIQDFDISTEVFIVGVSLFVLGFAIGPAIWGPLVWKKKKPPLPLVLSVSFLVLELIFYCFLKYQHYGTIIHRSELYGRRVLWIITHIAMVGCIGGSAGSQNITTLLILRFLAGTFGGSPLVNSGGTIADLFPSGQRGLAMTLYCVAPFLGPILGPVVGGFVSENIGWRWVQGICCILIGVIGIVGGICVPETYGPVLLIRKANNLSKREGRTFISVLEKSQGKKKPSQVFKKALGRPWVLLFLEPIVLVASLYMAIVYGTVYMFMGAMPIVYNEKRGWNEGVGGLAFLGIAVGIILGLVFAIYDDNRRYKRLFLAQEATPESRLPPAIVGAVALPVGMFAFAWTNYPGIHWSVSIILSAPFGFGCVLVILPMVNYLIDSYTIYAASVLAAAAIIRSIIGAVFPLFTTQMYNKLGIHWATSVPAFLTLACMPFPLVMYSYGRGLRMKCKYAFEAAEILKRMQMQQDMVPVKSKEGTPSE